MKYMGSKRRIAKHILPLILFSRTDDQWYVEPFCGGCNTMSEVSGNRIANDIHPYLIPLWQALVYENFQPPTVSKEEHAEIRDNKSKYPPPLVGWVGFNCSYSGVWFGGFAGDYHATQNGKLRNYQQEALNSVNLQISKLKGVIFQNTSYDKMEIPPNSIIYCDPPYKDTSKYKVEEFDHDKFWQWCREKSLEGHKIYVSEYNAPDDFKPIWQLEVSSQLSANGKSGGSKISMEKLFVYEKTNKPKNNIF